MKLYSISDTDQHTCEWASDSSSSKLNARLLLSFFGTNLTNLLWRVSKFSRTKFCSFTMALSFVWARTVYCVCDWYEIWGKRKIKHTVCESSPKKEFRANGAIDCFVCERDDRLKDSRLSAENNNNFQMNLCDTSDRRLANTEWIQQWKIEKESILKSLFFLVSIQFSSVQLLRDVPKFSGPIVKVSLKRGKKLSISNFSILDWQQWQGHAHTSEMNRRPNSNN